MFAYPVDDSDNYNNTCIVNGRTIWQYLRTRKISEPRMKFDAFDVVEFVTAILKNNYTPLVIVDMDTKRVIFGNREIRMIRCLLNGVDSVYYPKINAIDGNIEVRCRISDKNAAVSQFPFVDIREYISPYKKNVNKKYTSGVGNTKLINDALNKLRNMRFVIYEITSPAFFTTNDKFYPGENMEKHLACSYKRHVEKTTVPPEERCDFYSTNVKYTNPRVAFRNRNQHQQNLALRAQQNKRLGGESSN